MKVEKVRKVKKQKLLPDVQLPTSFKKRVRMADHKTQRSREMREADCVEHCEPPFRARPLTPALANHPASIQQDCAFLRWVCRKSACDMDSEWQRVVRPVRGLPGNLLSNTCDSSGEQRCVQTRRSLQGGWG